MNGVVLANAVNSTDGPQPEKRHAAGSFRELFFVSVPLIISAGSHSVMSIADRVMLAGYSPDESSGASTLDIIAAVTPASMLHWTAACVPMGLVLYANTFISQFDGAGNKRDLIASLFQAVWLAVLAGVLLLATIPFSRSLFLFCGHAESVAVMEAAYFNTLCGGTIAMLVSNALSCYFSGRRRTTIVMYVNVLSVIINICCDYVLIFGRFGLPQMGITGAATATVIARCCEVVMYVVLIRYSLRSEAFPVRETWRPEARMLRKYLRFGLPSGFHFFVDNSAFLTFLFIVGSMNRDAMAATNLAFSVNSLIFIPLLGFGTAVQTLVGHHIGARLPDCAVRTTRNAAVMGIVWTGAGALLLVGFPEFALRPFLLFADAGQSGVSVRAVLPLAANLLMFVAVYSVFDSLAVVFASALRGAGDTLFPMLLMTCSGWLIMTLPAWLIARQEDATVQMLWMTCTAHIMVMGISMPLRFYTGRWRSIRMT